MAELDADAVSEKLASEPVPLRAALDREEAGGLPGRPPASTRGGSATTQSLASRITRTQLCRALDYSTSENSCRSVESSAGLIRSRVIDQHVRGNTSSSTFRFVLASMLLEHLDLRPRSTIKKVVLDSDDNARLRQWQFDNLSITWCERERPWEVEDAVIAKMQPPLNSAANQEHPFYATVSTARAAFRAAARPC